MLVLVIVTSFSSALEYLVRPLSRGPPEPKLNESGELWFLPIIDIRASPLVEMPCGKI
jgi:hypothetical protein